MLDHDPELADRVLREETSLDNAEKQVKAERRRQAAQNTEPEPKLAPRTITLRTHKNEPVEYPSRAASLLSTRPPATVSPGLHGHGTR